MIAAVRIAVARIVQSYSPGGAHVYRQLGLSGTWVPAGKPDKAMVHGILYPGSPCSNDSSSLCARRRL